LWLVRSAETEQADWHAMNFDRLHLWLGLWRDDLKKPRDLLLGRSLVNLVQSAVVDLEERYAKGRANPNHENVQKCATSWERQILGHLEQAFQDETETLTVLKVEHAREVAALSTLLAAGAYDVSRIYPLLQAIQRAPSSSALRDVLRRELSRPAGEDKKLLEATTRLLLRFALTRHPAKALEELPSQTLARALAEAFVERHWADMLSHRDINSGLWSFWQEQIAPSATSAAVEAMLKAAPTSLGEVFDRVLWSNLTNKLLSNAAGAWTQALQAPATQGPPISSAVQSTTAPLASLLGDAGALRALGEAVVGDYARAFTRTVFAALADQEFPDQHRRRVAQAGPAVVGEQRPEPRPEKICVQVLDLLKQLGVATDAQPFQQAVLQGMESATGEVLGGLCARLFLEREAASVAEEGERIARELTGLLQGWEPPREINWADIRTLDVGNLCESFFAHKSVQRRLGELLQPLNSLLTRAVASLASEAAGRSWLDFEPDTASFWTAWKDAFGFFAGHYSGGTLPAYDWANVDEPLLEHALESFFDVLAREDDWAVTFGVLGIKPAGDVWWTGNATFYDLQKFRFTGDEWIAGTDNEAPPEAQEEAPSRCGARVKVRADSKAVAVQAALRHLNHALNVQSFALSVGKSSMGLEPRLQNFESAVSLSTGRWSHSSATSRYKALHPQPASESGLPRFARVYDDLLRLSARDPASLSEVQNCFLRALYWYRKGRWEPDPTARFLLYYVGLEHVFVRGKSPKGLAETALPQFHLTWRDAPIWTHINHSLGLVQSHIEDDPHLRVSIQASPDLARWEDNERILFEPRRVEEIIALTPPGNTRALADFNVYLDLLREKWGQVDAIRKFVEQEREMLKFRLHLLYKLRNRMVHEGFNSGAEVDVYAEELEQIFEDVLRKMARQATLQPPQCATVDQLTQELQQPWM
jgi:hypothetical protein